MTLMPLIFLVVNSFKSQGDIIRNPLALPNHTTFQYLKGAFKTIHFFQAVGYTLIIVGISLLGIVFFSSICAWMITRVKSTWTNIIYMLFVSAMLVPFQVLMYPLMSMMDILNIKNILGLILMYTGLGLSISVFMFSGFIKSVPKGVEEAAIIDGANIFQIYFYIILPLIRPMMVTVIILNSMWIWNDYLLPFLTLGTSDIKTLTLEVYYAKMTAGQFGSPWEIIFPSVLIAVIPDRKSVV